MIIIIFDLDPGESESVPIRQTKLFSSEDEEEEKGEDKDEKKNQEDAEEEEQIEKNEEDAEEDEEAEDEDEDMVRKRIRKKEMDTVRLNVTGRIPNKMWMSCPHRPNEESQ